MYIILVGGGKVGYYLTKTLINEGYEVFLIEKNPIKCNTYSRALRIGHHARRWSGGWNVGRCGRGHEPTS